MATPKVTTENQPLVDKATGGAYEGAARFSREMASWHPTMRSADMDINREKPTADARAHDMVRNDGYANGSVAIRKDSIVGGQYRLNAQPDFRALGADETWAEEFQTVVESRFSLLAESPECWLDASRRNTFTGLVRLAVGLEAIEGEVLATSEWLRSTAERRPYNTAVQFVDVARLCNPNNQSDTKLIRRGVERDMHGAPRAYHIRMAHPSESFAYGDGFRWKRVPVRKPWGRLQVIHIFEQTRPDQSRGISDMVAVLKEMKMTKRYQEVVLQNAVLNATYAAVVESELPAEQVWEALGNMTGESNPIAQYLTQLAEYVGESKGLHIDGIKIPHLFPGTKLNLKNAGSVGGMGEGFEESLLRHIAAALGLSYEQFSRDYTKTNYSSARASMLETWKFMQSRKKATADRFATAVYSLVLEEMVNKGDVPMPAGKGAAFFYEGLNREAFTRCEWIGASRGQIDELKETQAAILRIKSGLSTYEAEIARGGEDFRRVFAQRAREEKLIQEHGLPFALDTATGDQSSNKPNAETENDKEDEDEL